jgi:hypothetical protein
VQELKPLPPVDFVALQYQTKRELLKPFPCAQDYETHDQHLESLLNFCHNQLYCNRPPLDLDRSHLRGLVLSYLRAECGVTVQFLKRILNNRNCDPFSTQQKEVFQELIRELNPKIEDLRPKIRSIYDRSPAPHFTGDLTSAAVLAEKDSISGAVRLIWEVEKPIRAYLNSLISQRQVQEAGPSLQIICDHASNAKAKEAALQLNPAADLGPE